MVRQGKKDDIPIIQEIFFDSVNWMKKNHIRQWHYEDLDILFSTFEMNEFFVCINSNNTPVGFMILSNKDIDCCWNKILLAEKSIYLYKLTVKRSYAKSGYSSELLQFAKSFASYNCVDYIGLYCLKNKTKLRTLYESHGFRKIHEKIISTQTEVSVFYTYQLIDN